MMSRKYPSALQGVQENATTEVALALAMGFFSLMILTLVSMGNGTAKEGQSAPFETIVVVDAVSAVNSSGPPPPSTTDDLFVMYWNGAFFDQKGSAIEPGAVKPRPGGRLVLVVAPSSTLKEIAQARALLPVDDALVAEMNEGWIKALSKQHGQS